MLGDFECPGGICIFCETESRTKSQVYRHWSRHAKTYFLSEVTRAYNWNLDLGNKRPESWLLLRPRH